MGKKKILLESELHQVFHSFSYLFPSKSVYFTGEIKKAKLQYNITSFYFLLSDFLTLILPFSLFHKTSQQIKIKFNIFSSSNDTHLEWSQNRAGCVHEEETKVTKNISKSKKTFCHQGRMERIPVLPFSIIMKLQYKKDKLRSLYRQAPLPASASKPGNSIKEINTYDLQMAYHFQVSHSFQTKII